MKEEVKNLARGETEAPIRILLIEDNIVYIGLIHELLANDGGVING